MIDLAERAAMAETVRAALSGAVAAGGDGAHGDSALAGIGWLEMLDAEPDDAIDIVFGALGATNTTSSALDDVLAVALGLQPHADRSVVLPRFATSAPPGRIDAGTFTAQGLGTSRAATAAEVLAVLGPESEPWIVLAPRTSVEVQPVRGVDPDCGLRSIRVRGDAAGATRLDPAAWRAAVALGRRAVGHQIAGASRAMLELARTHAIEREQFGRPIARFQAVRHRLAEALVAVEALDAALTVAREQPNPDTAALAKAVAGRSAHVVARHCQQVLAGIGFTTEHRFHRYFRRALVLEGMLGSADEIVLALGRRLVAERRIPTLIEL